MVYLTAFSGLHCSNLESDACNRLRVPKNLKTFNMTQSVIWFKNYTEVSLGHLRSFLVQMRSFGDLETQTYKYFKTMPAH